MFATTSNSPTNSKDMATWRIYMRCSRLDTWDAIAGRGGGLTPFFLRPSKQGYER